MVVVTHKVKRELYAHALILSKFEINFLFSFLCQGPYGWPMVTALSEV